MHVETRRKYKVCININPEDYLEEIMAPDQLVRFPFRIPHRSAILSMHAFHTLRRRMILLLK
jgi:hypothetical protein